MVEVGLENVHVLQTMSQQVEQVVLVWWACVPPMYKRLLVIACRAEGNYLSNTAQDENYENGNLLTLELQVAILQGLVLNVRLWLRWQCL